MKVNDNVHVLVSGRVTYSSHDSMEIETSLGSRLWFMYSDDSIIVRDKAGKQVWPVVEPPKKLGTVVRDSTDSVAVLSVNTKKISMWTITKPDGTIKAGSWEDLVQPVSVVE